MTIRGKLFLLIGSCIFLVGILFFLSRLSTTKANEMNEGVRQLDAIGAHLLDAIVNEKEFLRTNSREAADGVIKEISNTLDGCDKLGHSALFSPEELEPLKKSVNAYMVSFRHLSELTETVNGVTIQLNEKIGHFNDQAMSTVEKVDEAVANAFVEGKPADVNFQSLSDATRTAIFLMNKITTSMSRDLFVHNDAKLFLENVGQISKGLKAVKINFSALRKRLKTDDQDYFQFIDETLAVIENLPEQTTAISELWPQMVALQAQLDKLRGQVLKEKKRGSSRNTERGGEFGPAIVLGDHDRFHYRHRGDDRWRSHNI